MKIKKGFKTVKSLFGKYVEIHNDWDIDVFKNSISLKHGYAFDSKDFIKNNGVKVIKIRNIQKNGSIDIENADEIPLTIASDFEGFHIHQGDILIALTGATLGKSGIVTTDEQLLQNQRVGNIFPSDEKILDKQFFFYVLTSKFVQNQMWSLIGALAQPNIGKPELDQIKFYKPQSLLEQKKIATIFSNVDILIEQTEKEIKQTEKLKKGLMQKFFIKGIEDKKLIPIKWLFKKEISIPEEWDTKTLLEISKDGLRNGIFKKADEFGSGVPLINVTDLFCETEIQLKTLEKVSVSEKELKQFGVQSGDIFFCRSSLVEEGVGQSNIILELSEPSVFECHVMMLRSDKSINPKFLFYYTRSHLFKQFLTSITMTLTMSTIRQPDLEMAPIILPSKDEQDQIASILTDIDDRILALELEKSNLEKLKKGLMQKLLTGEIRVKV